MTFQDPCTHSHREEARPRLAQPAAFVVTWHRIELRARTRGTGSGHFGGEVKLDTRLALRTTIRSSSGYAFGIALT
jgi:hypothetical protein